MCDQFGILYSINASNAAATQVDPSALPVGYTVSSMAFDSKGDLYQLSNDGLLLVDPTSDASNRVANLSGTAILDDWIAYGADGVMYGVAQLPGGASLLKPTIDSIDLGTAFGVGTTSVSGLPTDTSITAITSEPAAGSAPTAPQTPTVPQAPTDVQATAGKFSKYVKVTWDKSAGATAYYVYRSTSKHSATATLLATVKDATSYNDKTAHAGTSYYYWVRAKNSAGKSALSGPARGFVTPPTSPAFRLLEQRE